MIREIINIFNINIFNINDPRGSIKNNKIGQHVCGLKANTET